MVTAIRRFFSPLRQNILLAAMLSVWCVDWVNPGPILAADATSRPMVADPAPIVKRLHAAMMDHDSAKIESALHDLADLGEPGIAPLADVVANTHYAPTALSLIADLLRPSSVDDSLGPAKVPASQLSRKSTAALVGLIPRFRVLLREQKDEVGTSHVTVLAALAPLSDPAATALLQYIADDSQPESLDPMLADVFRQLPGKRSDLKRAAAHGSTAAARIDHLLDLPPDTPLERAKAILQMKQPEQNAAIMRAAKLEKGLATLVELLAQPYTPMSDLVTQMLADQGSFAYPALRRGMHNGNARVQIYCASLLPDADLPGYAMEIVNTLGKTDGPPVDKAGRTDEMIYTQKVLRRLGPPAVPLMIPRSKDADAKVRLAVARGFRAFARRQAAQGIVDDQTSILIGKTLLTLLADSQQDVRCAAQVSLSWFRGFVEEPLGMYLVSLDRTGRQHFARDSESIPPNIAAEDADAGGLLQGVNQSTNPAVRAAAHVVSLEQEIAYLTDHPTIFPISKPGADTPKLLQQVRSDPDRANRVKALQLLSEDKSPSTGQEMFAFIHDPDDAIRAETFRLLAGRCMDAQPADAELLEKLRTANQADPEECVRMVFTSNADLAAMWNNSTPATLVKMLRSKDALERAAGVWIIARRCQAGRFLNDGPVERVLYAMELSGMLQDQSARVRELIGDAAACMITAQDDPHSITVQLEVQALSSTDADMRAAALSGIHLLPLPLLAPLSSSTDVQVRDAALLCQEIPGSATLPPAGSTRLPLAKVIEALHSPATLIQIKAILELLTKNANDPTRYGSGVKAVLKLVDDPSERLSVYAMGGLISFCGPPVPENFTIHVPVGAPPPFEFVVTNLLNDAVRGGDKEKLKAIRTIDASESKWLSARWGFYSGFCFSLDKTVRTESLNVARKKIKACVAQAGY